MAHMEFENEKDLRVWLEMQPPEISVAIAARSAIRAIVAAFPNTDPSDTQLRASVMLPVFRAATTPWVAANYSTHNAIRDEHLVAFDIANAAYAAYAAFQTGTIPARAAAQAAALASDAASNALRGAAAAFNAAFSASDATKAAHNASSSNWQEASKDANFILEINNPRIAASSLCDAKLFSAASGRIYAQWNNFARELTDKKEVQNPHTGATRTISKEEGEQRNHEAWHVWTDWIDDRLKGKPSIEALEVERALVPEEDWKKGPGHVNHLIAAMIARHKSAARTAAKKVTIAPTTGALRQDAPDAAPTVPGDLPAEKVILSSRTTLLSLMAFHRKQTSWQEYGILEFEFSLLEQALATDPLDVALVFDACDAAIIAIGSLMSDDALSEGAETQRLQRVLLQCMDRLAEKYPSLNATHTARGQTAPAPMSPDEVDAARRAVAALQDILEADFRNELSAEIDTIELREGKLPSGANLDRVDRNARRRLAEVLLQIRRIGFEDIETLLSRVDESVDKAKTAEAYREAFRELDAIWMELREWTQSYFDE